MPRPAATSLQFALKRYIIGDADCSSLLFDGLVHTHKTADGDRLHFYEQDVHGVCYGFIVVKLNQPQPIDTAGKMLVEYLAGVRKPWEIVHGSEVDVDCYDAYSIATDYCQDAQGRDWKLRGYTNGSTLAVLYAKNIGVAPVHEHDAFLNGFAFVPAA